MGGEILHEDALITINGGKIGTLSQKLYDGISEKYKEKSLVQQKAALKLFDLLKIGASDDIIDIACGPGHITNWLSKVTTGKVTGIDISEAMIKQAEALYPEIEFRKIAVEDIDYNDKFDIVFCNSALQWFSDPDRAISAIFRSLKNSGKLGLACPATSNWSPWFGRIIPKVAENKDIKPIFFRWRNPWFHLPIEKGKYLLIPARAGYEGYIQYILQGRKPSLTACYIMINFCLYR